MTLRPIIESQSYADHLIIKSKRAALMPGINCRNSGIYDGPDPWQVSALWGTDAQIGRLADGIAGLLSQAPPTQRILQIGPLYTFDTRDKDTLRALARIATRLKLRGIAPSHVYLDWETALPNIEDYQFIYDKFTEMLAQAGMPGLPVMWQMANVRTGYQSLERNRKPIYTLCSHFDCTTGDRESTLRLRDELAECKGPKVVTLSTATDWIENKIRWNDLLHLLNPETDACILFPDGTDYTKSSDDPANALSECLKRIPGRLTMHMGSFAASTYDPKVST